MELVSALMKTKHIFSSNRLISLSRVCAEQRMCFRVSSGHSHSKTHLHIIKVVYRINCSRGSMMVMSGTFWATGQSWFGLD